MTINNATAGTVSLASGSLGKALTGTAADMAAAFTGITTYTGNLSISDEHDLSELVTINNATAGTVSLASGSLGKAITGTAADMAAAFTGITTYTGNLSISDEHDLSELVTINNATAGTVSLASGSLGKASVSYTHLTLPTKRIV